MDTLELKIELKPKDPWSDILIAELSELGFDSFVNIDNGILAYAQADINLKEVISNSLLNGDGDFEFKLTENIIAYQNWNEKWESDFDPVYVEEYASIIAPFHKTNEIFNLRCHLVQGTIKLHG